MTLNYDSRLPQGKGSPERHETIIHGEIRQDDPWSSGLNRLLVEPITERERRADYRKGKAVRNDVKLVRNDSKL